MPSSDWAIVFPQHTQETNGKGDEILSVNCFYIHMKTTKRGSYYKILKKKSIQNI